MWSHYITIDCWDTLLVESKELDEHIDKEIVNWLTEIDPRLTVEQAVQAVSLEAVHFSHSVTSANSVLTPRDRLQFLLQQVSKDIAQISDSVIETVFSRIDASVDFVSPKLAPWARQFLHEAQGKRFAVCMISNTGWISSRAIKHTFSNYDLADYIVRWYFSGDGYRPKPDPEMFQVALRDLSASVHQVIHIGDQVKTDGIGALAAGITPIILTGGRYGTTNPTQPLDNAFYASSLHDAWTRIILRQVTR